MTKSAKPPGVNSIPENLRIWDQEHPWPEDGDEWKGQAAVCGVPYPEWKQSVFDHLVLPFAPRGSSILEIACGRGRWSQMLAPHAGRLVLVDLSPSCIRHCAERFAPLPHVSTHVTDGTRLPDGLDGTMDLVWSFDAFVHMDRDCVGAYLREAFRVLRPGGTVVLHHPNRRHWTLPLAPLCSLGSTARRAYRWLSMGTDEDCDGWRSALSAQVVQKLGEEAGLVLRDQFSRWGERHQFGVPRHRDCVSVFVRPAPGEASPVANRHAGRITRPKPRASSPPLPSFLCLGAQKAGTTTLHQLLGSHPQVFLPPSKEIQYFSLHADRSADWYRAHFAPAKPGQNCGDITPYYLFHPHAPQRIARLLPDARLIVLVRDPVARAISGYFHSRRLQAEALPIEAAFAAEEERLRGSTEFLADPGSRHTSHQMHSYAARSRYELQIREYLRHFPAGQLLVIRSEDLFPGDIRTWHRILDFLRLDRLPLPNPIPKANEGTGEATGVSPAFLTQLRQALAPTYEAMARDHSIRW